MEDCDIIALYFLRDQRAIEETDHKYGSRLLHMAQTILGDFHNAEECQNDTYYRTWKSIPPHKPDHLFLYLAKLCRNLALNRVEYENAQKRKAEIVEYTSEMEACIPSKNDFDPYTEVLKEMIEAFLVAQPKEKRQLFIRRYWYMDSIQTLSKQFLMSETKVTTTLYRMRKELKNYLEKRGVTR